MCPRSKAVCAVLVLADSVRRLGGLGDTYDFVALVDRETPLPLYESLVKHNIKIEQMLFGPHKHVFDSYLLLRKLYIFKMDHYLRVLLLDIDGVVTGSTLLDTAIPTVATKITPTHSPGDIGTT